MIESLLSLINKGNRLNGILQLNNTTAANTTVINTAMNIVAIDNDDTTKNLSSNDTYNNVPFSLVYILEMYNLGSSDEATIYNASELNDLAFMSDDGNDFTV